MSQGLLEVGAEQHYYEYERSITFKNLSHPVKGGVSSTFVDPCLQPLALDLCSQPLRSTLPLGPFNFFDHDALTERFHSSSSQAGQEENEPTFLYLRPPLSIGLLKESLFWREVLYAISCSIHICNIRLITQKVMSSSSHTKLQHPSHVVAYEVSVG